MNASLQQQMQVIKKWLSLAEKKLILAGIPSSRLDAELILAHHLGENRAYIHSHSQDYLSEKIIIEADRFIEKRTKRIPLAYLLGHKEFYGRNFIVNNKTLIPRPESEDVIELLKDLFKNNYLVDTNEKPRLIDVGTGSGCLGITAKLELPFLSVALSDISEDALNVAKLNAAAIGAIVELKIGDLLDNFVITVDIIIANLPYVDRGWERSPETDYEPSVALFAEDGGMYFIKKLVVQAEKKLNRSGFLFIEADPTQHDEIIDLAKQNSFELFSKINYIIALRRK